MHRRACSAEAQLHDSQSVDINTRALLCVPVGLHRAGCTPGARPALRPKKEPGGRDRDISGVREGGAYVSEEVPGATPHHVQWVVGRTRGSICSW